MPQAARRSSRRKPSPLTPFALSALVVLLALGVALISFETTYAERIYPGVNASGVPLGGLTKGEAQTVLDAHFRQREARSVVFRYRPPGEPPREWKGKNEELGLHGQVAKTVESAYSFGREGAFFDRLGQQLGALGSGGDVELALAEDASRRTAFVARIAREIDRPSAEARLVLALNGQVRVQPALAGRAVDVARAREMLDRALDGWAEPDVADPGTIILDVPVGETIPAVVDSDLAPLVEPATRMVAPITILAGGESFGLDRAQIYSLLQVGPAARPVGGSRFGLSIDEAKLKRLIEELASDVDRVPRNARFDLLDGQVTAITPSVEGRKLDQASALGLLRGAFELENRTLELPVVIAPPVVGSGDAAVPLLSDLIERSTTSYAGGTAERRFNVELSAQRINGVVVPPGGIFSFNDEVGEVSFRSGYKRGWASGKDESGGVVTVPSEGGGICQVATTLFQTIFWSGYPIVERSWHSYWIIRYGLPPKGMKGLDATIDQVYDKDGRLVSETDLRFKNNTESPVLIQARFDGKNLTISLFGTKPDWQVKIDAPKIEKVVKADPTPVRQTDSTLAPGTELQIEVAQDGFQATIVRTVSRAGKVLEQRSFVSTYRPSRNVFVSGPKPGT